jgi:hypothetical protein
MDQPTFIYEMGHLIVSFSIFKKVVFSLACLNDRLITISLPLQYLDFFFCVIH